MSAPVQHAPTQAAATTSTSARAGSALRLGLPLGVSLFLHGVLVAVVLVVAAELSTRRSEPPEREVYVALAPEALDATMRAPASTPTARAVPTPPVPNASTRSTPTEQPATTTGAATATSPRPPSDASRGSAPSATPSPNTGALAPGGPPGGATPLASSLSSSGPDISFAGLVSPAGQRVRSVAYVVDASGPMVTSLPLVLTELRRSVDALAPTQRFNVVLFRGLSGTEGAPTPESVRLRFKDRLVDANARHRTQLASWLDDAAPAGRSNPLDGLRAALELQPRPQLIFLLSRSISRSGGGSWDLGPERTLAELERLNPVDPSTNQRPTIIKTIQFFDDDPTGIMQRIAAAHGSGVMAQDHRVLRREQLSRNAGETP